MSNDPQRSWGWHSALQIEAASGGDIGVERHHTYYGRTMRSPYMQWVLAGGSIYSTPEGGEVHVTWISHSPDHHGCAWPDIKPVGEVSQWLRYARSGKGEQT